MLTPRPPDPKDYDLGVDNPRYKTALVAWKARKQDERDHPEKYGSPPLPTQVVDQAELAVVRGQLAEVLKRLADLEKQRR